MSEPIPEATLRCDVDAFFDACWTALTAGDRHLVEYGDRDNHRNNKMPDTVPAQFNIYAIWERPAAGDWALRYIGQRETSDGVIRLRQHLFHCPAGTWSKRLKVAAAVEAGSAIAVSMIHVDPESMRLAVEDRLIARAASDGACTWNQKQKKLSRIEKKKRASSR